LTKNKNIIMPDSGELANGFGWGTFSVIVCIVIALFVTCIVGKSSRYPE
jgi:K+-transporting ATPase A subunit